MRLRLVPYSLLLASLAACGDESTNTDEQPQLPGLDASSTIPPDGGFDGSVPGFPVDAAVGMDAGLARDGGLSDASVPPTVDGAAADASTGDAATTDASTTDASTRDGSVPASDGGATPCPGSATPHGCYVAKPGNPMGCPDKIFEQSAFYPPPEEWKGCSSPLYEACVYKRPDGSEANCSCDFGLHWLCTY